MTTTLVATINRPVAFALTEDTLLTTIRTFPAGTTVYAREWRDGMFIVRIPGTLFEQAVYAATLTPA